MIMGKIILGNNVSVASQSLVNKSFHENNILLAGTTASEKMKTDPWYIRDGGPYISRIKEIETLKFKYDL